MVSADEMLLQISFDCSSGQMRIDVGIAFAFEGAPDFIDRPRQTSQFKCSLYDVRWMHLLPPVAAAARMLVSSFANCFGQRSDQSLFGKGLLQTLYLPKIGWNVAAIVAGGKDEWQAVRLKGARQIK